MKEFLDKYGLKASTLKWLAIIFMVLNHACFVLYYHVGLDNYFLSDAHWYITRFAFVIFGFQIAEGMNYTRNRVKYILYLFIFAAISEIPYNLLVSQEVFDFSSSCVLWALGLGATAIAVIDHYQKKPFVAIIVTALAVLIGTKMGGEYSFCGIPMMVCFYYFRDTKWKALTFSAIAFVIGTIFEFSISYMQSGMTLQAVMSSSNFWHMCVEEWHGLFGWLIIFFYNGKKGRNLNKWFFYGFYPGHILVLYLLGLLLIAIL